MTIVLQPFLAEIRDTIGESYYLAQLERLVMKVGNVEQKLENRRRLITRPRRKQPAINYLTTALT